MSAHKVAHVNICDKAQVIYNSCQIYQSFFHPRQEEQAYNPTAPFPKTQLGCLRIDMKEKPTIPLQFLLLK
jgi:hypothetical protein